jgi:hypothetical protein
MPITRRRRANPPDQPENTNNNHAADQTENVAEELAAEQPQEPAEAENAVSPTPPVTPLNTRTENTPYPPNAAPAPSPFISNGERVERQDYSPPVEGPATRRTSFRRPIQQPPVAAAPALPPSPPLQAPTHEIGLPLGNLLHLAYNPGYTGADEARSALLHQLARESKAGGRARCWSCGSLAIAYDCWNTRSKTFGEVGVAMCEICGVWSVM